MLKNTQRLFSLIQTKSLSLVKHPLAHFSFTRPKILVTASAFLFTYSHLTDLNSANFDEEMQLIDAGSPSDLAEGQMRELQVGPDKEKDIVLLAKYENQIYAVGPKCTHLGGPLAKGVLFGDRVYCPFHLASFSIKDGYHDLGPTYRALPTYKVISKDGKVFVEVPKKISNNGRDVPMVVRDPNDKEHFVLVGGGPAALAAAETLRQAGFRGTITMISKEAFLPYDRTMITKIPLKADEKLSVRQQEFFDRFGINIIRGVPVASVDFENNLVLLKNDSAVKYTKILLSPGCSPRIPDIKGKDLSGVFAIRELGELKSLQSFVQGNSPKNILIVGGSFVGAEIASGLKQELKEAKITILNKDDVLYQKNFGKEVGRVVSDLVTSSGVEVKNKASLEAIDGSQSKVTGVTLAGGEKLPADLVILATGIKYNTDFLAQQIKNKQGAIVVDKNFKTKYANVFAAGDATELADFGHASIQHYSEAINQGTYAAWNMLGRNKPYVLAPFFWTRLFNRGVQFVGVPQSFNDVVLKGDLDKKEFVMIYCTNENCHSASAMNKSREIITLNHAMRIGIPLNKSKVMEENFFKELEEEIKKKGHVCNCQRRQTNENKPEGK